MGNFLEFREIEKECREHYKKSPLEFDWSDKYIEIFFRNKQRAYSHYIKLIIDEEYPSLQETKLKWVVVGDFFEFLIKLCLLKENWSNLGVLYNPEKKEFYGFEVPKQMLIESLQKKVSNKQFKRIKEILNLVQLQRNNFVHNPLASMDHHAVDRQYLELVLFLNNTYSLDFSEEDIRKLKNEIKTLELNTGGMNFEDAGLI